MADAWGLADPAMVEESSERKLLLELVDSQLATIAADTATAQAHTGAHDACGAATLDDELAQLTDGELARRIAELTRVNRELLATDQRRSARAGAPDGWGDGGDGGGGDDRAGGSGADDDGEESLEAIARRLESITKKRRVHMVQHVIFSHADIERAQDRVQGLLSHLLSSVGDDDDRATEPAEPAERQARRRRVRRGERASVRKGVGDSGGEGEGAEGARGARSRARAGERSSAALSSDDMEGEEAESGEEDEPSVGEAHEVNDDAAAAGGGGSDGINGSRGGGGSGGEQGDASALSSAQLYVRLQASYAAMEQQISSLRMEDTGSALLRVKVRDIHAPTRAHACVRALLEPRRCRRVHRARRAAQSKAPRAVLTRPPLPPPRARRCRWRLSSACRRARRT